jgi:hypothetical protein
MYGLLEIIIMMMREEKGTPRCPTIAATTSLGELFSAVRPSHGSDTQLDDRRTRESLAQSGVHHCRDGSNENHSGKPEGEPRTRELMAAAMGAGSRLCRFGFRKLERRCCWLELLL